MVSPNILRRSGTKRTKLKSSTPPYGSASALSTPAPALAQATPSASAEMAAKAMVDMGMGSMAPPDLSMFTEPVSFLTSPCARGGISQAGEVKTPAPGNVRPFVPGKGKSSGYVGDNGKHWTGDLLPSPSQCDHDMGEPVVKRARVRETPESRSSPWGDKNGRQVGGGNRPALRSRAAEEEGEAATGSGGVVVGYQTQRVHATRRRSLVQDSISGHVTRLAVNLEPLLSDDRSPSQVIEYLHHIPLSLTLSAFSSVRPSFRLVCQTTSFCDQIEQETTLESVD